jgi:hypothetical protein
MVSFHSLLLVSLATLTIGAPTLQGPQDTNNKATVAQGREPRKRGLPYNEVKFTNYFNEPNSRVHWIYNWDSVSAPYDKHYEFVPMLWSDHPDHTRRFADNVEKCARMGNGNIHVLSFNEPDMCGYVECHRNSSR